MFGLEILDVAIGIVVVYCLFGLLAASIREAVESVVKSRAVHLERGIRELLDDPDGTGLAKQLYEHPLVQSLYRGRFKEQAKRFRGATLPTYIPAGQFAAALLDLTVRGPVPTRGTPAEYYDAEHSGAALSVEALRDSVRRVSSPLVRRALLTALDQAHGDLARVEGNLMAWFDGTMDRVSGWYKRRTQMWLFVIGLVSAAALNVNTLTIAEHLAHDDMARSALVERAASLVEAERQQQQQGGPQQQPSQAEPAAQAGAAAGDPVAVARADLERFRAEMAALNIPIGWDRAPQAPDDPGDWFGWLARQVAGLLLTAFAVTLGAPFWFDVLNKIMVIRSTVKPREKSPDEGSEDRRGAPPQAQLAGFGAPLAVAAVGAPAAQPPAAAAPPPDIPRPSALPFERHEWATGAADEGVL